MPTKASFNVAMLLSHALPVCAQRWRLRPGHKQARLMPLMLLGTGNKQARLMLLMLLAPQAPHGL